MLEPREALILQILGALPKGVVLVGGYAVNAYVPPRFSIDCDIVVFNEVEEIKKLLIGNGFEETARGDIPYGEYIRFMRKTEKVSFDLLLNSVLDRDTGVVFEAELFKKYSRERIIVGKADPTRIIMRVADAELLFAMKLVSARRQDIRDIFMLSGTELNWSIINEIIKTKCSEKLVKERIKLIKAKVESRNYRDSLHGAFGKIPDKMFERCRLNIVKFLDGLA